MQEELNPIRIIVLDRGYVLVCRCPDPTIHALWMTVTHSRTIRRWGTENVGLGALANGTLPETILDSMVMQESIPVRAILRVLEVNQEAWAPHLSETSTPTPRRRR